MERVVCANESDKTFVTESNTLRFNAKDGGTVPGAIREGVVSAAKVACKAHDKIPTAKSLFNAISTVDTVCVAEVEGVDLALSTNIPTGTVADTEKC